MVTQGVWPGEWFFCVRVRACACIRAAARGVLCGMRGTNDGEGREGSRNDCQRVAWGGSGEGREGSSEGCDGLTKHNSKGLEQHSTEGFVVCMHTTVHVVTHARPIQTPRGPRLHPSNAP